ncbi:MAG: flagellar biosynthesis protein FlhB [Bacilli bacterium]
MLILNLQQFAGEKTEEATPKKREDSRKKGQLAKSQDVVSGTMLLVSFYYLYTMESYISDELQKYLQKHFQESIFLEPSREHMLPIYLDTLLIMGKIGGPLLLIAGFTAIAMNVFQVGIMFTTETIQFKPEKLNPIDGFKRIFSMRSIVELFKSIFKILLIGVAAFSVLFLYFPEILKAPFLSFSDAASMTYRTVMLTGIIGSASILFVSVFDFAYQKFDFEKSIRMSKQDIKDEMKQMEGDPQIKGKIKQKQREMAMRRMMSEVPQADVIITNPTHFAIALKYDEGKSSAPVVVAKGVDFLALRIRELAKEHAIQTVENKPLARALYDSVEVGREIPEEFFKAVAEVLAYVYRVNGSIK